MRNESLPLTFITHTFIGDQPADIDGNLLLDVLVGAKIRFITREQYQEREKLMEELAEQLRAKGETPYIIPEGGSNSLGCWGYISMVEELLDNRGRFPYTHIVCAVGSGGTLAGLLLAKRLFKLSEVKIVGFNVCDTAEFFRARAESIIREFNKRYGTNYDGGEYDIVEGYADDVAGATRWLLRLAAIEGLVLDPVYTAKVRLACGRLAGLLTSSSP